jgi:hypothetical protein
MHPVTSNPFQYSFQLAANALNSFFLFDLFDDALADLFCLQTYTHGTSPRSYAHILWNGADPTKGGATSKGEGAFYRLMGRERPCATQEDAEKWNSRGKFYVFRDDANAEDAKELGDCCGSFLGSLLKKTGPRTYATQCTTGELSSIPSEEEIATASYFIRGQPTLQDANRVAQAHFGIEFTPEEFAALKELETPAFHKAIERKTANVFQCRLSLDRQSNHRSHCYRSFNL